MLTDKIKRTVAGTLDMPKDVALNIPKLILNGDLEFICQGYKKIFTYTDEEVIISAQGRKIALKGTGLVINSIEDEEIRVSGRIKSIEYI